MSTVPGPRAWPFIGNLLDLRQGEFPLMALSTLADQYGPIYKISGPGGGERLVVSSQKLVNELCDETRFKKQGGAPGTGAKSNDSANGLFFARNEDPDWGQAHRILMPAFGPLNIQTMFDEMHDIAKQLALSWARRGPEHTIDVTGDFTRLTLDSIALCAMGYRFNSFYQAEQHPYVDAMTMMLEGMSTRNSQLPFVSKFTNTEQKIKEAQDLQAKIAGGLVQTRRDHPTEKNDLLNSMINGKDPKTGEKMRDALIMSNMNTFLIAGHETTSGMLSFAMYLLLKNPASYNAVQEEVDRVLGGGALQAQHLRELKYINAVLRETLRLYPTAPAFRLVPKGEDETWTLGDYVIEGKKPIVVLLQKLHRDPEVYGDNAEQFRPERMLDENFEKLPPNSWKPFGNGMRSCIGRSFAWQEALMALAICFQRFNFRLDDPSYEMKLKFALTIKPKDMYMHATLRNGLDPTDLELALNAGVQSAKTKGGAAETTPATVGSGAQKLKILYGTNTGTCEALAQRLVADAGSHGFVADKAPLDSATGDLPTDGPVFIVCPSYEGQPPDNGIHFVEWLQGLSGEELKGVKYAVYGCGHHDWHDTFHRVPKLIDEAMSKHGGERITHLGLCDVAQSDVLDQFDDWKDKTFWPAISKAPADGSAAKTNGVSSGLTVEVSTEHRGQSLHQDVGQAVVLEAKTLTHGDEPEKRHLDLQLPTNVTYKAGDYLAVLPLNPAVTVRRVMKRFALPWDSAIKLDAAGNTTSLPSDLWLPVHSVLRGYVELSQPPSKKDLRHFLALTSDAADTHALEALLSGDANKEQVSTLDVLEKHASVALPFADFLALLPPLRTRLYSISSSPLREPSACTISYGVLNMPGPVGYNSARHPGVASTYLASLQTDDRVSVAVRPSRAGFHLPPAGSSHPTPIVMIGAGTGLAPFRAFVQERALQLAAQGSAAAVGLAPALLFVGCRSATRDRLYAEELDGWATADAVETRYAFSREAEQSEGCKYVQDRLRRDAAEVRELWDQGGKIYICGAASLVRDVGAVLKEMLFSGQDEKGRMEGWLQATRGERIVTDVFG